MSVHFNVQPASLNTFLGNEFSQTGEPGLRPLFNGSNILTSSNGNEVSLIAPFTGLLPEDSGFYSCLLVYKDTVIFNRTIQLNVLFPTGPTEAVALRFSTQSQEQLDEVFNQVYFAPPGLPTLAALVSQHSDCLSTVLLFIIMSYRFLMILSQRLKLDFK